MTNQVHETYGNRLRVRACGILVENGQLLMVNHRGLGPTDFWAPPGGGVDFGEPAHESLKREFLEEVGLEIEIGDFLFACEFISSPLHAVELFFRVKRKGGKPKTGLDPEMNPDNQIIKEVRFLSWQEIAKLRHDQLHGIFRFTGQPDQVTGLTGYFTV